MDRQYQNQTQKSEHRWVFSLDISKFVIRYPSMGRWPLAPVHEARFLRLGFLTDTSYPASSQTNGTTHNHEQAGSHEVSDIELENAEYYQTFLSRFLTVVGHGQPEAVSRLIGIIRAGASEDEIFAALADLRADIEPPESEDTTRPS
ncbi:uncharacterized protein BDV17DRAFT_292610 [Aspergillus undulatus]|uniref:uncharacterized protein n=1 Tax=Aspergillus undulatus TaxID=1810928 RepID=UPI003CCD1193